MERQSILKPPHGRGRRRRHINFHSSRYNKVAPRALTSESGSGGSWEGSGREEGEVQGKDRKGPVRELNIYFPVSDGSIPKPPGERHSVVDQWDHGSSGDI